MSTHKGKYISATKDLIDPNSVLETRLVNEGEMSTIFLENSIFLNLVVRELIKTLGTHTLKYELIDKHQGKLLLESYKTECRVCAVV